ncbi:cell division protein FtsZ [bacterium]|nr:cell division protein FtsZ [bacterium]
MEHEQKSLLFDFVEQTRQIARIRVVGVGGAGGNAINRMIEDQLTGVDFIAMNTDLQALEMNKAPCRIQIGKNLTRGLGAGGVPEVGRKAIEENKDAVIEILSDTDMVFIAAGMGGGTGTGAAPVVAEIARDLGALTVGIVTKPFMFEGGQRTKRAEAGIRDLKEYVDTLIAVPNQKLLSIVPKNTPLEEAFRKADEILLHATKGISDVINIPGLVNLDFADVQTVMCQMGDAIMGSGIATGDNRGKEAAEDAIHSSMIDDISIKGAKGVLVNITGGKNLAINDIHEATSVVYEAAGDEANIIFGAVIDPLLDAEIRVTVIATGFNHHGISMKKINQMNVGSRRIESPAGLEDIPVLQKLQTEPLESTLGEIFGHDGGMSFVSENDLNVPAYLRKSR